MTEVPQSIADRIASLKLNQVGRGASPTSDQVTKAVSGRPRPPPPPTPARPALPGRPALPARAQSSNVPTIDDHAPISNGGVSNLPEAAQPNGSASTVNIVARPTLPPRMPTAVAKTPALPSRMPTESPSLPPRRPSEALSTASRQPSEFSLTRRGSNESTASVATARSSISTSGTSDRMKAPAYDPSSLPALPPKRTKADKEAAFEKYNSTAFKRPLTSTKSSPSVPQIQAGSTPPVPSRPEVRKPSLPARVEASGPAPSPLPMRKEIAPPPTRRPILSMGFNNPTEPAPTPSADVPDRAGTLAPPPIPSNSRPDLDSIRSSKPQINGIHAVPNAGSFGSCLLCRDYSGPDHHAAKFPRQSLPSNDLGWLAQQLTAPFGSATDKARALFTWLHHNVAYDTVAFFNDNVKPSTPQSTIQTGLAVCEGYAGLFAALAMKVGMEAYVIAGHGKGYGYAEMAPGSPLPLYSAGHAWNVVKIDGGQWKLIDCCWGAGAVGGKNEPYSKRFAPERFTQSNDDFGLDHFPGDGTKQFRNDGRVVGWEEYINGNKNGSGAFMFNGYVAEEGLDKTTFKPTSGNIVLAQQPGPTVRFSFQKICPHWDPVRCGNGPYFLYVLHLEGLDGTETNHIPFQTNGDVWWCDVATRDLGRAGQKAQIYAVNTFDGADGRGLTIERYREMKGRCGMSFGGVCLWQIA